MVARLRWPLIEGWNASKRAVSMRDLPCPARFQCGTCSTASRPSVLSMHALAQATGPPDTGQRMLLGPRR